LRVAEAKQETSVGYAEIILWNTHAQMSRSKHSRAGGAQQKNAELFRMF